MHISREEEQRLARTRPVQMTDRQRFVAQMHYQPVDRCPIWDFGLLDPTREEWYRQGLPHDADSDEQDRVAWFRNPPPSTATSQNSPVLPLP